ncbi:MAG TPA: ABC transporter substrate-binding protein [Spirochaetota bacterium]|nr:ABC transporter substrate-binding protein [Spirochaetota bacterium]
MKKNVYIFIFGSFILFSCSDKEIKLGFGGSLSGKDYMLGVDGLNTVELLVNQVNEKGGIKGRKIRLLVEDFKSDLNNVIASDRRLIDNGAIALIGHFTSSASSVALQLINNNKIVLLSPTSTSEDLSGKEDYFFRTIMTSKKDPEYISKIMKKNNIKNIALIKTKLNKSYADTYVEVLREQFNIVEEIEYEKIKDIDVKKLYSLKDQFDAEFIIATAIDSGAIAQLLRVQGIVKPLYLSGWAASKDLVLYGGKSVEGAVFIHQANEELESLKSFREEYMTHYGDYPNFGAIQTYEAFQLVIEVLKNGGTTKESFYREIKKIDKFQSIAGEIKIDKYGDAIRDLYIKKVSDGKIVVVEKIKNL